VYVVAVGMIPFGKYVDRSMKELTAWALQRLWDDSPVGQADIEAAWFSNSGWGMQTGQHCIRGQAKAFEAFLGGTDVELTKPLIAAAQAEAERRRVEMEASGDLRPGEGGGARSPMMDIYATGARAHMEAYGSTQEQLAIIASKSHLHGWRSAAKLESDAVWNPAR
jgi:acetyl-CoA acetyltransferase